jgi:Flp pilus assembly protein CpaB
MKRNIVPLLGIAFVVAIISTGIFYGLFAGRLRSSVGELPSQSIVVAARTLAPGTLIQPSDLHVSEVKGAWKGGFSKLDELVGLTVVQTVQQNEPILLERVASPDAKIGGGASGVRAGMRAVSIRVAESSGVIALLRPGTKVDVQAVARRADSTDLRTILQNVEVLAVSPQPEPVIGSQPLPVVTVLTRAQDEDLIALADSGARIRLTLRNPLDDGIVPRRSMALASIFASNSGAVDTTAETKPSQPSPLWNHPIRLHVTAMSVSAAALDELASKLAGSGINDALSVTPFRTETDTDQLISKLEQKHEIEQVSSWRLTAGVGRPISFRAGVDSPLRLVVQFSPELDSAGKLRLRVRPEIRFERGKAVETRQYFGGVRDGESFLVRGLLPDTDKQALEQLYPGHSWSGRQLVILVTSHAIEVSTTASLVPR